MNVTDFRGISISCVVSKVMEHFIFDRYQLFFLTSDNQFGFKNDVVVHTPFILLIAQLIIIIPATLLSPYALLT
jgi:hypothetical protein